MSRVCIEPGCWRPTTPPSPRCAAHHSEYVKAHPRGAYAGRTGTTGAWRRLKAAAKRRDGDRCTATLEDGTRCQHATKSYHHLVPRYQGGEDVLSNVVSRCKLHHDAEHAERPGWGSTTVVVGRGSLSDGSPCASVPPGRLGSGFPAATADLADPEPKKRSAGGIRSISTVPRGVE